MADEEEQPKPKNDAPPAGGGEPYAVFRTAEELNERLLRAAKSGAKKELGMDLEEAKRVLAEAAEFRKQKEEADRQAMSETDRLRADAAAREAEAKDARRLADDAVYQAKIYRICAEKGVKNHDYAAFRLSSHRSDPAFDMASYLDQLIAASPSEKVALGMDSPPPQEPRVETRPGNSQVPGHAPPPPGPNGGGKPASDAFSMTAAEWAQKKAALG